MRGVLSRSIVVVVADRRRRDKRKNKTMDKNEAIYERVNDKVAQNIRKETRDAVRDTSEGIIKKLVDRGFQDADVRTPVKRGIEEAYGDINKK